MVRQTPGAVEPLHEVEKGEQDSDVLVGSPSRIAAALADPHTLVDHGAHGRAVGSRTGLVPVRAAVVRSAGCGGLTPSVKLRAGGVAGKRSPTGLLAPEGRTTRCFDSRTRRRHRVVRLQAPMLRAPQLCPRARAGTPRLVP